MHRGANVSTTFVVMLTLLAPAAIADDSDNWKRLEAMPRDQRVHLSTTLERFDTLPSDEKAAIRELDAAVAKLDPVKQARYHVLLRRYHVWVKHLNDDQTRQLAKVDSIDARLKLVESWRKAEKEADTRAKANLIFGVQPGDLGSLPPFEMANSLRVWSTLDEKEKKRISDIAPVSQQIKELTRIGWKNQIPMPRFAPSIEGKLVTRIEKDQERNVKAVFPNIYAQRDRKLSTYESDKNQYDTNIIKYAKWLKDKAAGKIKETEKPMEKPIPPVKPQFQGGPIHFLAESLYFMDHPPAYVSEANLLRFEAEIPSWLRAVLDPLPPEDARRRLKILYREIHPVGEIPPAPKPEPAKAKEPPKPPSSRAGGSPVPL
jgi:hypothetical protein